MGGFPGRRESRYGFIDSGGGKTSSLPFYTQKKLDVIPVSEPNNYLQQSARVFLIIPENQLPGKARVLQRKRDGYWCQIVKNKLVL
jgi:hypothetical protein